VYPTASPGGWRLLGTALRAFAPDWIEAGDIVVFRAVAGAS
jgi:allophanate hydrolase subunit 1